MIRYALRCHEGHGFDSWFPNAAAFDEQSERGLVACPACHSRQVSKAIMAPALVARRGQEAAPSTAESAATEPDRQPVALVDDERRQMVRAFHQKVLAETRDVGPAFAAEARRIQAGATQERIRGQASLAEARELVEDGIMVVPLPTPPDDLN